MSCACLVDRKIDDCHTDRGYVDAANCGVVLVGEEEAEDFIGARIGRESWKTCSFERIRAPIAIILLLY